MEKSEVGEKLTVKDGVDFGDSFQFDHDLLFHQTVYAECVCKRGAIIRKRDVLLSSDLRPFRVSAAASIASYTDSSSPGPRSR